MAAKISIVIPYLVIGIVSIVVQFLYLIYFRGRINGIILPLSRIKIWWGTIAGKKFFVDWWSIFIVGLVSGTPFVIYIVSGIHLAAIDSFESIYILLILSLHTLLLALLFWYMRKWRPTLLVKIWMSISSFSFMIYLIAAINLDDFYSLSGSTAIFMSCSFIFSGALHHHLDMIRNRVYFVDYLSSMSKSELHETSEDVIQKVHEASKNKSIKLTAIWAVWYVITILGFCISVNSEAKEEQKALGWMHSLVVVVTDSVLLSKLIVHYQNSFHIFSHTHKNLWHLKIFQVHLT